MADAEKTKTDAPAPAPATGGVMDKVNEFLDRPVMNGVEINRDGPVRAGKFHSSRRAPRAVSAVGALVGTARITLRAIDAPTSQIPRAGRDDRRRHREDHAYRRARGRRQGRARRAGERLAEGG